MPRQVFLLLLCLTACDPVRKASLHVNGVDPAQSEPAGGEAAYAPLANVAVIEQCPDRTLRLGTTDASGSLRYSSIGFWEEGCTLRFEPAKAAYRPRVLDLTTLCAGDERCHDLRMNVDLLPNGLGDCSEPATQAR